MENGEKKREHGEEQREHEGGGVRRGRRERTKTG